MVVKGTRGNEGAERSGVHDEEHAVDQVQSLGGHHRRMCARKTGQLHM